MCRFSELSESAEGVGCGQGVVRNLHNISTRRLLPRFSPPRTSRSSLDREPVPGLEAVSRSDGCGIGSKSFGFER